MNLEIVEMHEKYLDEALAIYSWYVANSTATFQIQSATIDEMRGLLFFEGSQYRSFAALEDGRFVGYGIITRYKTRCAFARTAEITVYLHHEKTGRGYGKAMVTHLEAFARSGGLHVLIAQISGENSGSCTLFERCGYRKCSHYHEVGYKFERWIDLVCYEKKL